MNINNLQNSYEDNQQHEIWGTSPKFSVFLSLYILITCILGNTYGYIMDDENIGVETRNLSCALTL